jgi:hypothetical protein
VSDLLGMMDGWLRSRGHWLGAGETNPGQPIPPTQRRTPTFLSGFDDFSGLPQQSSQCGPGSSDVGMLCTVGATGSADALAADALAIADLPFLRSAYRVPLDRGVRQ